MSITKFKILCSFVFFFFWGEKFYDVIISLDIVLLYGSIPYTYIHVAMSLHWDLGGTHPNLKETS